MEISIEDIAFYDMIRLSERIIFCNDYANHDYLKAERLIKYGMIRTAWHNDINTGYWIVNTPSDIVKWKMNG